jgi:phenylpropionate dioxygenase-like ring-hydroxylating dioxygenase large terminal subunit
MSDIASQANLSPAVSQLPVSWYFDEKIFELEKRLLFDAGPGYVGHELMVPEPNQFRSLEWLDHSKLLINRDDGFYRMSNICRHRQAVMMQGGRGRSQHRVPGSPLDLQPRRPADRRAAFADNPCLNLQREKLERWQGLLFKGPRSANADLAGMQVAGELDFSGYKLDKVEIHECNYNWKTFIEVYLEDYHVVPFHPGLGSSSPATT